MRKLTCLLIIVSLFAGSPRSETGLRYEGKRIKVTLSGSKKIQREGRLTSCDSGFVCLATRYTRLYYAKSLDGAEYHFDRVGASYDSVTSTIVGRSHSGNTITVPVSGLERLRATFYDGEKQINRAFASHVIPRVLSEFAPSASEGWRAPADSVNELFVWQDGDPNRHTKIGVLLGTIAAVAIMSSSDNLYDDEAFFGTAGIYVLPVAGYVFGRLISPKPGWKRVPAEELRSFR